MENTEKSAEEKIAEILEWLDSLEIFVTREELLSSEACHRCGCRVAVDLSSYYTHYLSCKEAVTYKEAAEILGIINASVRKLKYAGSIEVAFKVGHRVMLTRASVEKHRLTENRGIGLAEAAEILGTNKRGVYLLVSNDKLKAYGQPKRFDKEEVMALAEERRATQEKIDKLISRKDAAAIIGIAYSDAVSLENTGLLTPITIEGHIYYEPEQVEQARSEMSADAIGAGAEMEAQELLISLFQTIDRRLTAMEEKINKLYEDLTSD